MRRFVGVLILLSCLAACGSDGDGESAEPTLPPNDREAIAEIFDPALEELGLRLTRGALIDTRHGYAPSDDGRHLAVYVEPTGPYSNTDYVEGIMTSARVFLPEVFERWPDLETFDVCQEPLPADDDRPEPPPLTQVFVSREESEDVDWSELELAELLALLEPDRQSFRLYVDPDLKTEPAFLEASPEQGSLGPAPTG